MTDEPSPPASENGKPDEPTNDGSPEDPGASELAPLI